MDYLVIIQTIIILLFSGFFSGLEIAFVSSSKLQFEMDKASKKGLNTRILNIFYTHPSNFISTLLVGNNIALVIYGILMARLIDDFILIPLGIQGNETVVLLIQTVLSTLIVLVTGEYLPKTLFRINPNGTMNFFAVPALFFYIVLYPISKFTDTLSKLCLRLTGTKMKKAEKNTNFSRVDLDHLIKSNIDNMKDNGEVNNEVKIFHNAMEFSTVKLRDCIVPRTEINAVQINTDIETLKAHFTESGHSKIVVYNEDIDDIVGFVHSSEMFHLGEKESWNDFIREMPIVPETMPAQKMMKTFLQEKKSMAIVVDEFGGTSGIVTMEDLVEEIFGDIQDEHDVNNYVAKDLGGGEYIMSARLEIERANELLGLTLPESEEYQTVGGLILHEYQDFPKLNEVVKFDRWEFKILKSTTTKIELVRLKVES